jgi:uncharacterized spore protein YtfJ
LALSLQQYFQSILDRLQTSANVKTVYGDAITAEGKTIIPVARVAYGFHAGTCPLHKGDGEEQKEAGKGGGGIHVKPVGVLEITKEETKFIPIDEKRKLVGALLIGLLLGLWIAGRRSRE